MGRPAHPDWVWSAMLGATGLGLSGGDLDVRVHGVEQGRKALGDRRRNEAFRHVGVFVPVEVSGVAYLPPWQFGVLLASSVVKAAAGLGEDFQSARRGVESFLVARQMLVGYPVAVFTKSQMVSRISVRARSFLEGIDGIIFGARPDMLFHGKANGYVDAGRKGFLDDMNDADLVKKAHTLVGFGIDLDHHVDVAVGAFLGTRGRTEQGSLGHAARPEFSLGNLQFCSDEFASHRLHPKTS